MVLTGNVAYVSQPILVRGSSIGAGNYQPITKEQILTDANIALTGYTATTSAADGIINLEAASSGMIGKGVKAVLVKAYGKDSAAGDGVGFGRSECERSGGRDKHRHSGKQHPGSGERDRKM